MKQKNNPPDYWLFITVVALMAVGLLMIYSASGYSSMIEYKDSLYFFKKQLIWIVLGLAAMRVAMVYNYNNYRRQVLVFLGLAFGLLLLVLLVGESVKGATRQIFFFGVNFSPSELAKLCLIIVIASGLAGKKEYERRRFTGVLPLLMLTGAAAGLIMLQPDLGTATILLSVAMVMVIAAGLNFSGIALTIGLGLVAVNMAIHASPYRFTRLMAFLNPWEDPLSGGYQTVQGLYAIGSGGFNGLGLGQSMQKYLYLPERHTDFIFAIIGEELGFIGVTVVIALFAFLMWRGLRIALTSEDVFASLLAAGITAWIGIQAIINIAMVAGKLPVTGITLPFVSYGGSSLISIMLGVGILLNISQYTASEKE